MAIVFTNKSGVGALGTDSGGGVVGVETRLLSGVSQGTIVKSLELMTGGESCHVDIVRKDASGDAYATIRIDLKAYDYLVLWEGFFVIPYNHGLYFTADSTQFRIVANVVEVS